MPLRVLPATKADIPRCIVIQFRAFASSPGDNAINGVDSPANLLAPEKRFLKQMEIDELLHMVMAVDSDLDDEITSFCTWFIYPRPRNRAECEKPLEMLRCDWVEPQEQREKAKAWVAPLLDRRRKNVGGRPHGLLMCLAIDPAHQRKGAGGLLVNWGLKQCDDPGIEAYLEASVYGAPVYYKCGFEKVDDLKIDANGVVDEFPAMLREPA